jgi:hypothetical protein
MLSLGALGGIIGTSMLALPLLPRLGASSTTVYACWMAGVLLLPVDLSFGAADPQECLCGRNQFEVRLDQCSVGVTACDMEW